jgi:voltage-gated potassium channel Kch
MASPTVQRTANLGKAAAVYLTSQDTEHAKALALTLRSLYPLLPIYVRVRTLADQVELSAMGIKHAGTGYIESTLVRGGMLLKDLGQSEEVVDDLVRGFQRDGYAFIRNAYAEVMPQEAKS